MNPAALLSSLAASAALWASGMVFLAPLRRKNRFRLLAAAFLPLCCLVGAAFSMAGQGTVTAPRMWLEYAAFYAVLVAFCRASCEISLSGALYAGVWAVVSQQMSLEICGLFLALAAPPDGWRAPTVMAVFLLCCCGLAFTVARWMPENGQYRVGPRQLSSSLLLLLLFEMLVTLLIWIDGEYGQTGLSIAIGMAQVYCLTVLYLQNTLFKKSAMKQELETLNLLWHQQKEQYSLARENIALINQKCHDLKHQVAAMRAMGNSEEREKYLEEIENSVEIYDSIVKTGSEALDTLLTEKSLYCEKNRIKIHCVADGGSVEFMDPVDLYAIFGNALDNAIESVEGFAEDDKRFIDVIVRPRQGFLVINVINPLEGQLTFEEELPVTTKAKNGYHGFGLKSIRHTVKKYGGVVNVDAGEGSFSLRIVIPLPEQ